MSYRAAFVKTGVFSFTSRFIVVNKTTKISGKIA